MILTQEKNEKIAQAYEQYKLERAQRQAEEKAAADERAKTQTYYASKKPKVVVTRVVHQCSGCNKEIEVGSKAVIRAVVVNGSSKNCNGHFETLYYCSQCKPVGA